VTEVEEFLSRYTDSIAINNALSYWKVTKAQVDGDIASVNTHGLNAQNAIALQSNLVDLKSSGDLLSLYSPQVERHMEPGALPFLERRINSMQNLINAACIELRGKCSDSGVVMYTDVKSIKAVVEKRIAIARRIWDQYCTLGNAETDSMNEAITYLEAELQKVNKLDGLFDLGTYVESIVPQLPVMRRWWNV
jgi:hypothetical protein